jgi:quinoprotein glucose dehydrogenase
MKFLYRTISGIAIILGVLLSLHLAFPSVARSWKTQSPVAASGAAPVEANTAAFELPPSAAGYQLVRAFTNLKVERPITVVIPPDGTKRMFLVQQRGKIVILPSDEASSEAPVFLDITDRKFADPNQDFEMGLLGLAFHPRFAQNGKFYISHTRVDAMRSVVSELQVARTDPATADLATERILLEQQQPFWNHKSGNIAFGPDGYLYITFGDGGGQDDPLHTAQNVFSLLGKVLRIDVNRSQGSRAYGIPADNPFARSEGACPEIWAYGFRNPWGMSFDGEGNLWLGDVGQDLWEEVDVVVKGGNYGWSFREGARPFFRLAQPPPASVTFIDPIFEYPHSEGISVTGGFVYRGEKIPNLKGAYIYGDWGLGRIWALWMDKTTHRLTRTERIYDSPMDWKGRGVMKPSGICEDATGEVLVLDWSGAIFRLASTEASLFSTVEAPRPGTMNRHEHEPAKN